MGVGRFSRPLKRVGVLTVPDAGQDITRCVESAYKNTPGAGVLRLCVTGVAVGVLIDGRCVADGVGTTC